ncbi:MAG: fused MFS/spermidine synthase [Geodermatophilaceae bacterium]|nr:fused MFS/spermidine synthase [Geodermatophilaceae bacterium]
MPDWLAGALVFLASAAVLVLEIVGLRLIAPYIGITLETSSAIIGVALAAIAAGAWTGGRLADETDPRRRLGLLLLAGGALMMLVPPVVARAGQELAGTGAGGVLFLAALAVFFPAAVLSAVPPMVVKLQLASLSRTGTVVGRLSGIGTVGAIAGTFLTGFVLVTLIPSRLILIGTGGVLLVAGAAVSAYLRTAGSDRRAAAAILVVGVLTAGLTVFGSRLCDVETSYHCARVVSDPARPTGRLLLLDTLRHSYVDAEDPTYLEFNYVNAIASVADVIAPPGEPLVTLHIGGGGLTIPRYLAATRPGGRNVVLEVDPGVAEIAQDLRPPLGSDLNLRIVDGRVGLGQQGDDAFDLVVGDAFGGLSVPWHLTTREAVQEVRRTLRSDGVYALNVIDYPPGDFARAEMATVLSEFDHVAVVATAGGLDLSVGGNYVIVASDQELPLTAIQARLDEREAPLQILAGTGLTEFVGDSAVLTDDYAPVDQLLTPYR